MSSVTTDLFTALGMLSVCGLGLGILLLLAYQVHSMRAEVLALTQQQNYMAEKFIADARLSTLPRIYHVRVQKKVVDVTIAAVEAGGVWTYYRAENHDGIADLYFKRQS
jgi:hypothetical protein